jgi:DNA helicase-2/ATP-dependent DNA helicase PcrA
MPINRLNPDQKEAVTALGGPQLVLAGAGTGKTRVLTTRIAHLIMEGGVDPQNILAVTFTNKAAGEMRERIEEMLGAAATGLWLGTFHSIGLRILRREGGYLDIAPEFTVYNDDDQISLIKLVMKELGMNDKSFSPRAIQTRIDQAKNELIGPDDYLLNGKGAGGFFAEKVQRVYAKYQKALREMNAVDFGDLLACPVKLFKEKPEVLEKYQKRFVHILVDEYQDTNRAQYMFMNQIAEGHRNLCAVGDPDQSVYGWRGADIRNILDFQTDWPDAEILRLEENYRSTKNILAAANSIIEKNEERLEKTLWTGNDEGELAAHVETLDERDEVRAITDLFKSVMDSGVKVSYRDVAVFYRTNAQSRVFEEHFIREGIPYVVVGGLRFYERKEIKDALALLRSVANPTDAISFRRIINTPPRGIGKVTLDKIIEISKASGLTYIEATREALSRGIVKEAKIGKFLKGFERFLRDSEGHTLSERTQKLIEDTGYMSMLVDEATEESLGRAENLHELISAIKDFELSLGVTVHPENAEGELSLGSMAGEVNTLAAFLDHVALISDMDSFKEEKNSVTLMTLHSAKGLEFPVVFIAGLEDGLFPHQRSLDSLEQMEEERRLCYVGMTRAKERLFLTSAASRTVYGETRFQTTSRFLDEINPDFLASIGRDGKGAGKRDSKEPYYTIDENQMDALGNDDNDPYLDPSFSDVDMDADPLSIGMKVKHPSFGNGVIRAREGSGEDAKVTVRFKGIDKKLVVKYANLTFSC